MIAAQIKDSNSLKRSNFDRELNYSSILFGGGGLLPVGSFSSNSTTANNSGYTDVGSSIRITYEKRINKRLGFTSMIAFSNYIIGDNILKRIESLTSGSGYILASSTNGWKNTNYLAGIYHNLSIKETLKQSNSVFFYRLLAGISSTKSPLINLSATNSVNTITIHQSSARSSSFTYLVGFGVKAYSRKRKIVLQSSLDYFSTNPKFSNINFVESINGSQSSKTLNLQQPIKALQFLISLGYYF